MTTLIAPLGTFELNGSDFGNSQTATGAAGVINAYGYCSNYRATMTWTNLDIRAIIGEEAYWKYKSFTLVCIGFSMWFQEGGGSLGQAIDRSATLKIGGLPFIRSYDTRTHLNSNMATIAQIGFSASAVVGTNFTHNTCVNFSRVDKVNMTVVMWNEYTQTLCSPGTSDYINSTYWKIYPYELA